jgi:hypothetical protein
MQQICKAILSSPKVGNRSILIIAVMVIAALIVDTSLERVSDLLGTQSSASGLSLALFIVISVIAYGVGQYLVLSFINYRNKQIIYAVDGRSSKKNRFVLTQRLVFITQYVLTTLLISVILLIVFASYFYTIQLILSTVISYALSIFLLSLLSHRFFSWHRSNRNFMVLSYGFACGILAVNLGLGVSFVTLALWNQSPEIRPHLSVASAYFSPDSPMGILYSSYVFSEIGSFLSMWISTTLLLRHHSRKLGRAKFWVMVTIPLAYFLSPFIPSFLNQVAASLVNSDPISAGVLFTLIFAVSKPTGGILFGVAFWAVARTIRESILVRDYMIMSALGMVVLFVSSQGTVINAYYPPFGLVTVLYVGLGSFMLIIGLYSSAISVSQDDKLRKTIRKNTMEESKLLDSIGTAQMGQDIEQKVLEIERKVMEMAKEDADHLIIKTGVKPSLEEPDMKRYLEEVMKEVQISIQHK